MNADSTVSAICAEDEHDPAHWRYWASRIKGANREWAGADYQVKTENGWKPVPEARDLHEAARIAAHRYGGTATP